MIGFVLFHLGAVAAVLYMALGGFSWATIGLAVVWYWLSGFSITGGYHRLFSHRAYRSSRPLRWFFLLFGAAAFQTSVLNWCSDHRRHHAHSDKEGDPYSVTQGFWWAHMKWMLVKNPVGMQRELVQDLEAQRSIELQHRYYLPLALFMAFLAPALIASLWGDFWGGLLVAGALRLTTLLHATWCINSLAHTIGRRPYDRDSTARDNGLVALITFGEGYHNFHHRFPGDYRNGIRWYHLDPTKWFVWALARVGLTQGLRRTPAPAIARARASSGVSS